MKTDSKFSAARRNGASPAKRSGRASKVLSNKSLFDHWPYLQQTRQSVPDSRPEAVERARRLIADPGYPPEHEERILARQLAIQLTAEIDPLPT